MLKFLPKFTLITLLSLTFAPLVQGAYKVGKKIYLDKGDFSSAHALLKRNNITLKQGNNLRLDNGYNVMGYYKYDAVTTTRTRYLGDKVVGTDVSKKETHIIVIATIKYLKKLRTCYEDKDCYSLQVFTMYHELGHFLINKDGTYPPDIKGTEMEERLADRVGLNIMQMRGVPVPYIMHRNGMYKNIFTLDEDLVDYSYEVMKHLR